MDAALAPRVLYVVSFLHFAIVSMFLLKEDLADGVSRLEKASFYSHLSELLQKYHHAN